MCEEWHEGHCDRPSSGWQEVTMETAGGVAGGFRVDLYLQRIFVLPC